MSKLGQQRRFVPLLLADDYQSVPPLPPGDGDGDGDIPTGEDLCAVEIEDGGGDTFDCYEDNTNVLTTTLNSGNGFEGAWLAADSPSILRVEDFESYGTGGKVGTLDQGDTAGFDGPWIHDDDEPEVMVLISGDVGFGSSSTSVKSLSLAPSSIGPLLPGSLLVAGIMHRSPIVSGLEGWTLIDSQINPGGTTQYTSVYAIAASAAPEPVVIEQDVASRLMFGLLLLGSADGSDVIVDGVAKAQYLSGTIDPGLHPVQGIIALGNGRLGVHFSSCILESTATKTWVFNPTSSWKGLIPIIRARANNRFNIGIRRVNSGENTADGSAHATHPLNIVHEGAEVTVLFGV